MTNKILVIWCNASLPTVSEKRVTKILADYHHKYLSILKSFDSRKEQTTFKQKVENFESSSKVRLFDICSCKCTDFNQCSCKRELKVPTNEQMFLTDQKTSRQLFIGGIDVGATKNMKAKASRELKKKKVAEEKEVMKNSSSNNKSNFYALDSDKALEIDSKTDDEVWNPSAHLVTVLQTRMIKCVRICQHSRKCAIVLKFLIERHQL